MIKPIPIIGQIIIFIVIAIAIGGLSRWPTYSPVEGDAAQITVSFSHGGERREECHRRTAEELAKLAPNMRKLVSCPRERLPLYVEVRVDGQPLLQAWLPPTGLSKDGPSHFHKRFVVPAGTHEVTARLRTTGRQEGYDYSNDFQVVLSPRQNVALSFRSETGGFSLQ